MKCISLPTVFACFAVSVFVVTPLLSDTIHLRNGGMVTGRIVNQSRTTVTVQTAEGEKQYSKEIIMRISYETGSSDEEQRKQADAEAAKKGEEARKAEEIKRLEEQRRVELERRASAEQQAKLAERENFLPAESATWSRMHMDISDVVESASQKDGSSEPLEEPLPITDSGDGKQSFLWRSALVPGWGQYHRDGSYNSAYWAGGFFLSAFLALELNGNSQGYTTNVQSARSQSDLVLLYGMGQGGSTAAAMAQLYYGGLINNQTAKANRASLQSNGLLAVAGIIYVANILDVFGYPSGSGIADLSIRTDGISAAELAFVLRF